jgi:predicted transcriptional regulator YdeE
MKPIVRTERSETPVMFLQVPDDSEHIREAWDKLERLVGSRRGRKFYGIFNAVAGTYRACVEVREGDHAEALGLQRGKVEGGLYVRMRLRQKTPAMHEQIVAVFEELQETSGRDRGRPRIEYYRGHGEVDVLMPVVALQ